MARTSYAIALGSNRPHGRYGRPEGVLAAAIEQLREFGDVESVSAVHRTAAMGPAGRSFANAALILTTPLPPLALLDALKAVERRFGRRGGRRWGARVLDLDVVLWSGGAFRSRRLAIPHPGLASRLFVLEPLAEIAPHWPVPGTALAVRHLRFRLRRY